MKFFLKLSEFLLKTQKISATEVTILTYFLLFLELREVNSELQDINIELER